jgi:hypothetical protein
MNNTQSKSLPPSQAGRSALTVPQPTSAGDSLTSSPHFALHSVRRRSAIARLPKVLRGRINEMLDDGLPYAAIREQLTQQGANLTEDCIGRWKRGGYQDHLRDLRLLDESRSRYELTLGLAREEQGIDVFQAAHKIAAALICEAVAEIGADSLREAVKLNPLNLLRMLNSLSRLTTGGLKCERHLSDQAERNTKVQQQQIPEPKKGISSGSVQEMETALNLM